MKFRTLLSIILIAIIFAGQLFAAPINMNDATKVAKNFMFERFNQYQAGIDYEDIIIVESWAVDNAYYVFNLEKGWVIVSSRSERWPVIGYNYDGNFSRPDVLNYNTASWMNTFVNEAIFIDNNQVEATDEISQLWAYYLTDYASDLSIEKKRDVVTPLLTNLWNQDHPYNIYCPVDPNGPGGHVYVGCVATAMAMIMHYWRYPLQGQGVNQYFAPGYGVQYVNFGETFYNWDAMHDVIENTHPYDVALISYHAAVSVNMAFAPDGSGAYSHHVPGAMVSKFRYLNTAQYLQKSNYPNTTWETMMQEQLDLKQPLYYSGYSTTGGGHAFVCDGYQGSNYYHFNFGWGGSNNGWFNLQTVGGFPSGQGLVRNLVPNDPDYPYLAEGEMVLTTRSGSFTDGSGPIQDYPEGMEASWLISPQSDIDTVNTIHIGFRKFNTAPDDYVKIFDGPTIDDPLIAEYSGDDLPDLVSIPGNQVLVTFNTTGSAPGFVAEYYSFGPSWCESSNFFTQPSGIISDGSGQYQYNNGTTCLFILQVPDATVYNLSFTKFSTEADKDIFRVINANNQTVASLSGNTIPEPIQVNSHMIAIAWSTNSVIRDDGWELYYETDAVAIPESTISQTLGLFPNPASSHLQVTLSLNNSNQIQVSLLNMEGQVEYTGQYTVIEGQTNFTIPLHGIAKGVYLLRVHSNEGLLTRKVVIQ